MAYDYRERYLTCRRRALDYLGAQCVDCGTRDDRVLVFDHALVRRMNGRTVGAMMMASWDKLKVELDKCQLVCANCHMIRTLERKEQGNFR